MFVLRNT